jgi:salicylate hydroxylase
MSSPASRIVIIGAGIGGLTLALLLRRRGIIAEILEQAPELREVGAAVALAANGTRVLQHLDLGDGLAQASARPCSACTGSRLVRRRPGGGRRRHALGGAPLDHRRRRAALLHAVVPA